MNGSSRLRNSVFNMASGFVSRFVSLVLAFVVRTVFIHYLSTDYLGINGLYTNILSMLSLADLGFGTAMVYSMYKPLAQKDYSALRALMSLYKKAYLIIGTVIFLIGMGIAPFLNYLIKDAPNVDGLTFYYVLFLVNSCMSYWFFAYRTSIITADQKQYIVTNCQTFFNLIKAVLQVILLVFTHSYTVFLLTQIGCTIGQNIVLAIKAHKMYPVFQNPESICVEKAEQKRIMKDVSALSINRIAHVALNGTDNVIISAFVGIGWVGLLSNYIMVTEAITGIYCQITGAITSSLGNYFATEDKESGYTLFRRVDFLNSWLYGFAFIAFVVLLNPFVTLWLGEKYVLSESIVIALATNFYVAGFMNALWTFRSTLGLFTQGKYRPIIVAFLNIVLSIVLSLRLGVFGVLLATSISRACVNLWYDPWLIHRDGFQVSVKPYFADYVRRILCVALMTFIMLALSQVLFASGITLMRFIILTIITGILPNVMYYLVFRKREELRYFADLMHRFLNKR